MEGSVEEWENGFLISLISIRNVHFLSNHLIGQYTGCLT